MPCVQSNPGHQALPKPPAEPAGSSCAFQPTCRAARGTEAGLGAGAPQRAARAWACQARLSLQSWGAGGTHSSINRGPGLGPTDPPLLGTAARPEAVRLQGEPSSRDHAWRLERSELVSPASSGPGKGRQDLQGALQPRPQARPRLSRPLLRELWSLRASVLLLTAHACRKPCESGACADGAAVLQSRR